MLWGGLTHVVADTVVVRGKRWPPQSPWIMTMTIAPPRLWSISIWSKVKVTQFRAKYEINWYDIFRCNHAGVIKTWLRFDGARRTAILTTFLAVWSSVNHANRWRRLWAFHRALQKNNRHNRPFAAAIPIHAPWIGNRSSSTGLCWWHQERQKVVILWFHPQSSLFFVKWNRL